MSPSPVPRPDTGENVMLNTRHTRRSLAVMLVTVALLAPTISCAENCDPGTEARLQFLESRLDAGERNAKIWWGTWMAVFSVGVVYGVVSGAALHDDQSNQANAYMTAGKSALGIAQLALRPHVARYGAEKIRAIPKSSSESCAERLRLAEQTMETAAREGSMRWSWQAHLTSLVLNLGAGLAISYGWHDEGTGWKSFGISETSAEAHIWTHPYRARADWSDYRNEFNGTPLAREPASLNFGAQPGGVGVVYRF